MCIQILPSYNSTLLVANLSIISEENDNIYIDTNNNPPLLIPIQSPQMDFEYLHLIDEMNYENIQYMISVMLFIYGIYCIASKVIHYMYKLYVMSHHQLSFLFIKKYI